MSARREYEMTFKVSGSLGKEFTTSFRNASNEMKTLQTTMQNVNTTLKDINAYKRQSDAIKSNEERLERLQKRHQELQQAMQNTSEPSEHLCAQMERNERQIQTLCDTIGDQNKKLRTMGEELEKAGVNTDDLATKTEHLKNTYAGLEKSKRFITEINDALDDQKAKLHAATTELATTTAGVAAIAGGAYALTGAQAKDFETAFAGVQKTVDATEAEFQELRKGIIDMSQTDVTATAVEIAAVAESAGQLGIQTENILEFSNVIIDLSESTNLAAEQGASDLAKFANITKMSQNNFDELGSTIVDLGNNFATTEADIVDMGIRLASTGELTGLSEAEIMAMATALSSLGIEAEAGGTAASKLLKKFELAFATGEMEEYASVAGMTEEAFASLYSDSSLAAISAFTKGLTDEERNGRSAIQILEEMEIKEVRLSNAVLALATSDDILTKAVDTANKAWEENTALTIEAEKRYATTESRMDMAKNSVENLGIVLGDMMLPLIKEGADNLTEWAMSAQRWVTENQETVAQVADLAVKVGGAVLAFKTMKVAYHGLNTAGLTVVNGVNKIRTAIKAADVAAKGSKLSTFTQSLTGLKGKAASYVAAGSATVVAIAAITTAVWAWVEAEKAAGAARIGAQLFDNDLPKIEDYTEALKDSTSTTLKFAEEVNATETELQDVAYEMSQARADVELYGHSLRTEAILTPEEAEALKQPFSDLVGYLEDDFEMRYTTVFDAFSRAASDVATNLGVDIATISSTLDTFKSKYTGSLSDSEQVVNNLFTKRSEGGVLTTDELNQLRTEMAYIADLSANESLAHANYELKTTEIQGMDFGNNKELAIQNVQELVQYGQEYLTEIDAAQQSLNQNYEVLRDKAATMLEHGKMTQDEYDLQIQNLNLAQGVTYEAYLANREEFTTELQNTATMLLNQVDSAIANEIQANGTNFWDNVVGTFGAYFSGQTTGSFTRDQAMYAKKNAIDGYTAEFSDLVAEINKINSTAQITPIPIPIEFVGISGVTTESEATYNPGLPQYASGTNSAPPGFALVGEEGPELVQFGGGERVYTASETRGILTSEAGGISVTINQSVSLGAGTTSEMVGEMNDDLTEKIKVVIIDILENQRRNAYA